MSRQKAIALFVLSSLCLPLAAQEAEEVAPQKQPAYFSITADQTYLPGETPVLSLWANNVNLLEFRVYRLNDPLLFFQSLRDLHSFGGRAPKVPHERTLLERFHAWKRDLAADIRDFVRGQFSADSRHQIRAWLTGKPPEQIAEAEGFAAVPLLNKEQLVAIWRQHVTVSSANRWESQKVPVPVKDKGVYLIEATNRWLKAYTIVIVTDTAMVVKLWPGHTLTYLVNRKSGTPIAGAQVYFGSNHREIATKSTDPDGLAEINFTDEKPENVLIVARAGDEYAVSAPETYSLSTAETAPRGYIYTDRPVYRPGHIVHFKAIVRARPAAEYQIPTGEAQVAITDSQNKIVYQKGLRLSKFGSLSGEFEIPATATLGNYTIRVMLGSTNQWSAPSGNFFVEEYKKPEYEVRVTPEKRRLLQGKQINAVIEARYFFGEPVANAKVTYVLHREPSCRWCGEEFEEEGTEDSAEGAEEGGDRFSGYGAEQAEEKTGKLDADGRLRISLPTKVDDKKNDMLYRVEARVTDQANREITGSGVILATYGSFRIGVDPVSYMAQQGTSTTVRIRAQDYDNKPVQTAFRLEAIHREWWGQRTEEAFFTTSGQTDDKGEATVTVPTTKAGSTFLRVTATTPEKREIEGQSYLWITGNLPEWAKEAEEHVQVRIIPDKKIYHAGETAKLQIVTGTAPTNILVTAEGTMVHFRQVVKMTEAGATVEVPIRREQIPTLWANVAFIRDNRLRVGTQKLKISTDEQQIMLAVKPSKPQFAPGDAAVYQVEAKDSQGRPVSAEVSVGVVDEAIYSVRPEQAGSIVSAFYSTIYNSVGTESSLSYYFQGEAGVRRMQLTRLRRSPPFGQLKPEPLVQPKVRKAFPDTAFWAADVQTDASGRGQVKFNFPDALTQWRATARAVTQDTKVGSAVEKVIVRKNLLVRLVVPRFLRQGDEVVISTLIHNYLPTAKVARVSMGLKGLQVIDGATRDVNVESRGEAKVDWRVRAENIGNVTVLGKALTNEESDAMELTLPVIPYGVKQSVAASGAISEASGEAAQTLKVPPQAQAASRALDVEITPSVAGVVFGALDYLTSYPYGCTEQTMSSFLPNVVVADALGQLKIKSNVDKAALDKKVRVGMDRLLQFQHQDGGWGWWQTDDSAVFMTAYVLQGMGIARAAGYEVNRSAIKKGQIWLRRQFDRDPKIVADLRAYMALALFQSGSSDPAPVNSVWENRSKLTPYGLAVLGLTMVELKDSRAAEIANDLERAVKADAQTARWEVEHDWYLDFYGDTTPEATAYAVKFLLKAKSESPLIPKAVFWLVAHRNEGYYWESTKQTAMIIYGITDYMRTSSELKPDFAVQVFVNDQPVTQRRFTAEDALAALPIVIHLPSDKLGQDNRVRVIKKGTGRLYWSAYANYYSDEKKLTNQGSFRLSLVREYYKLTSVREGEKIVYQMDRLSGPVQAGDILAVHLTVSGSDWRYLLAEDPIPAGTEFIEKDDLYELKGSRPNWWTRWFTHREFHDDRAAFFQTWFNRGQTEYFYLLKVVNPGVFRISPARAFPMYEPEFMATTDAEKVEAR